MASVTEVPAFDRLSDNDQNALIEFENWLQRAPRGTGATGGIETWFDGDVHLVAPGIANRTEYIIVDGKLEVAP